MEELVALFALYGPVNEYRILHEYPAEKFTEVYLVKLQKLQSARIAKRKLDGRGFFGSVLHICYAPEFESIDETRDKLRWRQRQVERICPKQAIFTDKKAEDTKDHIGHVTEQKDISEPSISGLSSLKNECIRVHEATESHRTASTTAETNVELANLFPFPMLPPPPQHQPNFCLPCPAQRREEAFDHALVPSAQATLPTNIQALFNNAGTDNKMRSPAVRPGSGRPAETLSCGQPTLSRWQRGNKSGSKSSLARFVPRAAALQLRKIRRDNECKHANVFTTEGEPVMAPYVGPKLPGIPKTVDLGNASLNTTADLIRTKLNKTFAVQPMQDGSLENPVLQSEHPSVPAPKQRRRI
uniref:RNA-binding protein 48-like n=1 Tax=Myxine glutinosa TaxID=7769 RepID=UPI00358EB464